jgi:predicted ribosomally synthesized peptide with nif11-like leader
MSEEQLKAFLEALKTNTDMQERIKAATEPDAIVSIAEEAGFTISKAEADFSEALSDWDLEGMAGGMRMRRLVDCNCGESPTLPKYSN